MVLATTLAVLALARPLTRPSSSLASAARQLHASSSRRRVGSVAACATAIATAPAATGELEVRKRVLSGVQPTGVLHLGNYLGAIRQWVANQEQYDNFFCVVDLHAITAPHTPKELTKDTYRTAALYLASGIDPERSSIFVQSHVTAHAELMWLLNCATPMGWLEKMIQYKEKASKQGAERASVGLFDYPVLMAADILLYQTQLVPVGEDQRQHLELTRDIARRFNDQYCANKQRKTFVEPEALIQRSNARVMSLQDGTAKMSKSAENDMSRINLLDPPDLIARKIKRCKTDSVKGLSYDDARPEAMNLLGIYEAMTGRTREQVAEEIAGMEGWGTFKPQLTEALIAHLEPLQKRCVASDQMVMDGDPLFFRIRFLLSSAAPRALRAGRTVFDLNSLALRPTLASHCRAASTCARAGTTRLSARLSTLRRYSATARKRPTRWLAALSPVQSVPWASRCQVTRSCPSFDHAIVHKALLLPITGVDSGAPLT
jgi:tryptophanyl-tRNA synthetase